MYVVGLCVCVHVRVMSVHMCVSDHVCVCTLLLGDIDEDADMDEYWDEYMTSRSKFPESWLWVLRDLPNCAENDCYAKAMVFLYFQGSSSCV